MSVAERYLAPTPLRPARSRRRRRVTAAVLLAPVVALAAWTGATSWYDPLEQGSGILAFGVVTDDLLPRPQQTVSNAFGTEYRVVTPAVGSRVGVALGLANAGPFAVEVLDVGNPFPDTYLNRDEAFGAATPDTGGPYEALAPFVLAAGDSRDVGVSVLVAGCPEGGPVARSAGALIVDRVPVTWRWLGRTRTTDVPLVFRGALEGLPGCLPS